ncbi:MAG TPA: hypothetical protein VGJ75_15770, partial [Dongiaceae bacterium]
MLSCRRGFFIPNKFSSEGSRQCGPFGFQALGHNGAGPYKGPSTCQTITIAIEYAEKALGNRDYFLNKPYGV